MRTSLLTPDFAVRFNQQLYATYLSYLPDEARRQQLAVKSDQRGGLAEFIKSKNFGQIFVSRTKPGITRGNHYHHTKTEKFFVVEGEGIIRMRQIESSDVVEYRVRGDGLPGDRHSAGLHAFHRERRRRGHGHALLGQRDLRPGPAGHLLPAGIGACRRPDSGYRMRVATVVGTRPEIIRLSRVIAALDRHMDHVLIHTGQNYDYELNGIFFEDLEIRKPDYFLEAAGKSAAETIGNVIAKSDEVLGKVQPDAMLVLGDTNSCLAAIAAKRRKIPVFHMEAGNRCFDERVPEEINRKIVDHISDINLPYSDISREYLLREGLPPDRIIKTGSPMFEVLSTISPKIEASDVLARLGLKRHEYFVVSAHREENIDSPVQFAKLVRLLNGLAERLRDARDCFHASAHAQSDRCRGRDPQVREFELLKPLGLCDYVHLQMNARATLSDSGTITEESSILNFPALNIREAHETARRDGRGLRDANGVEPEPGGRGLAGS